MLQPDLFSHASASFRFNNAPLAYRMRPKKLDDVVGQQHFLGKNKVLQRIIEADQIMSLLFFGPPGCGKTTLAEIIANLTQAIFVSLNAVEAKVGDVRDVIAKAEDNLKFYHKKTILFVDEIHRFNKAQQDVLLKDIEKGTLRLIGATTANPLYSLNAALVSRSRLFEFKPLSEHDMLTLLHRAIIAENGLASFHVEISDDLLRLFVRNSDGDVRQVFNNLELAVLSTLKNSDGSVVITSEIVKEVLSAKVLAFDANEHYDLISAFIKSMRASNEKDALYYLARMIKSGEDPLFIARRMVIFSSEDIGLADSQSMRVANEVYRACETIGMPEARIILSHGVIYLCRAEKNRDAYNAIELALQCVENMQNSPVPSALRNW